MAWDPNKYNKFKSERFNPFYDLLALIQIRPNMDVIDLGCGTGELTRKLADKLTTAHVVGIDSSKEMLNEAQAYRKDNVEFIQRTIEEQLDSDQKWDLIFSNAAIQWSDDHEQLIPKIIACLKKNGQLAIQIPSQHDNLLNKMLDELVNEEPFKKALNNWSRSSPVLKTEVYAALFFDNGCKDMTIYEKIYPLIVPKSDDLFEWIAGTALIPYTERFTNEMKEKFIQEFKTRIRKKFSKTPVLYPFKRILMEATF
jgi:trans-aconitate 2-methyltransferase